jgi:hypothetical protein
MDLGENLSLEIVCTATHLMGHATVEALCRLSLPLLDIRGLCRQPISDCDSRNTSLERFDPLALRDGSMKREIPVLSAYLQQAW